MQRLGWDAEAELLVPAAREEVHQKGRVVILPEDLNEWGNGFLNSKTSSTASDGVNAMEENADVPGSQANSLDANSKRTLSWDYVRQYVGAEDDVTSKARRDLGPKEPNNLLTSVGAILCYQSLRVCGWACSIMADKLLLLLDRY
ncbi:hypothetical protein AHAS_Ahas06G0084800 [Arachis hypogaea]